MPMKCGVAQIDAKSRTGNQKQSTSVSQHMRKHAQQQSSAEPF